jgi:UDP-hydrolysing UDP-N-acetyl-D-glucosamine 2-epimerase
MNNLKRKICVPIINRANYGRLKPVLEAIQNHPKLQLQLIVGSSAILSRYGNAVDIIEKDGFIVDRKFHMIVEGENPTTMVKSTGLGLIELASIFEDLCPDIVIAHGDRFETIAIAIAASFMNIYTADTMAGEVSGSIDESIRHALARFAHMHFVSTKKCEERLISWGEEPERIFRTGCPGIDNLKGRDLGIDQNLFSKYTSGVGNKIDLVKPYLVVLQHPVTTEEKDGGRQAREVLEAIHELNIPTVWFWPNVDAGSDRISREIRIFREKNKDKDPIYFIKNISPDDFNKLIYNCACLVGNSSVAVREGSFLGIPVVNIGNRQSGRESGHNAINVGYDKNRIIDAVRRQISHGKYESEDIYGDGSASKKIADILAEVNVPIQKKLMF